ncbi:unnamed protein product [Absidia cylindrospora]
MSLYRCPLLYRPLQHNFSTCFASGNNISHPIRRYTTTTPVLYQKNPIRLNQSQHPTPSNTSQTKVIKPRFRPGDWICPQCHFHNHSHQSKCGECATKADASLRQAQRGDWICPHCEYYNFRQRLSCKQCEELRPSPSELAKKYQQRQRPLD